MMTTRTSTSRPSTWVGRAHRPWLGAEVGELGIEVLRAAKGAVDPRGVLNPGVLVPAGPVPATAGGGPGRSGPVLTVESAI